MRKPRVLPILLTAAVSAALLFGGWSLYKQKALAAPLSDAAVTVPGVEQAGKPVIEKDRVIISLKLSPDASLRSVYEAIGKEADDVIGSRKLELDIESTPDDVLQDVWSKALFRVAEAMETRNYSDIPEAMQEASGGDSGIEAVTEMDGDNVYITLRRGEAVKFVVLPREPVKLGVWPNA